MVIGTMVGCSLLADWFRDWYGERHEWDDISPVACSVSVAPGVYGGGQGDPHAKMPAPAHPLRDADCCGGGSGGADTAGSQSSESPAAVSSPSAASPAASAPSADLSSLYSEVISVWLDGRPVRVGKDLTDVGGRT